LQSVEKVDQTDNMDGFGVLFESGKIAQLEMRDGLAYGD
jgi:hypothetical protein